MFKLNKKKELFEQLIRQVPNTMDLYPILRLIFPDADSARGAYGLKEHTMGKMFSDVLALPERETKRLLGWKDPNLQARHNCTVGDFPSVLLSVIEPRMPSVPIHKLTIKEANDFLTDMYQATDPEIRKDMFRQIIYKATPMEIKWIIRMILKDMKINIGVESILRHLHPEAINLFHISNSLHHVLSTIANPNEKTGNSSQVVTSIYFQPLKPMLSERVCPGDIPGKFSQMTGEVYLEPKLDGERMLVHVDKRNQRVSIISRNGVDFTNKYGDHQLSPIVLTGFKGLGAVFDGELVSWNSTKGKIQPFGTNRDVGKSARREVVDDGSQELETSSALTISNASLDGNLFYIVFDIIFYVDIDGKEHDLRGVVLDDRRDLLERVLVPVPHRFELIKYIKTNCGSEKFTSYLKGALDRKEEGIVVKRTKSVYKLNIRGMGWYKIKADYDETFTDTIDLVVVGGYFSDSSTMDQNDPLGAIASFLCAAPQMAEENGDAVLFKTVVKVGTGLTVNQFAFVRNFLRDAVIPFGSENSLPEWFGNWKPRKENRPDIVFSPWMTSLVLEIRAGELNITSDFSSGYTCRFPRIVKIRLDKDWTSATSFNDLRDMASRDFSNDRIFIQNMKNDDVGRPFGGMQRQGQVIPSSPPKKRQKSISVIAPKQSASPDTQADFSAPFRGVSVYVLNGDRAGKIAQELGAELIAQYSPGSVPVADRDDIRVKNFVSIHGQSVLGIDWLEECRDAHAIVPIDPIVHVVRVVSEEVPEGVSEADSEDDTNF